MIALNLYSIAAKEFNHEVCVDLVAAHAVHVNVKVTKQDVKDFAGYVARVEKAIKNTIPHCQNIDLILSLCFAVNEVVASYEEKKTTGNPVKTFKQVMEANA